VVIVLIQYVRAGLSLKTADFLKSHPMCCFCGGSEPATTVDHQPAKILFPDKRRPKGLEFPACKTCNRQSSADECLLAFVSRLTGAMRNPGAKPDSGFSRALESIRSFHPGLFPLATKMVWVESRQALMPAMDVNRAEINEGICRVAAKLALATYYLDCGRIAGPATRICTQWAHNQRRNEAELVHELLGKFPRTRELRQGAWNTSDSFFIRYLVEGDVIQIAAVINESVALMAQFLEGAQATDWERLSFTWAPVPGRGLKLVGTRAD
jgi:hypothetical protein